MKKVTVFLCSLALVFGFAGVVGATPILFDIGSNSSVSLTNISTLGWTDLDANLVTGLANFSFSLDDNQAQSFDFIRFQAQGTGAGTFDVNAGLGFDRPENLWADFSGFGGWFSLRGHFSGGYLFWENPTQSFNVDENVVRIAVQQGIAIGGNSAILRATVTNLGGGVADVTNGAAPVPEPSTMLLLGAGLLGLVAIGRRKYNPEQ